MAPVPLGFLPRQTGSRWRDRHSSFGGGEITPLLFARIVCMVRAHRTAPERPLSGGLLEGVHPLRIVVVGIVPTFCGAGGLSGRGAAWSFLRDWLLRLHKEVQGWHHDFLVFPRCHGLTAPPCTLVGL